MPRPRDTPLDRWERISRVVLGFPGDRRLRHGLKLPATRLWSPEPGTTVHLVPVKFPGPDVGPLKKNARGTLMELRRRKKEIGREKKQLDFEEANVDEAIALLEEEVEEDVEEEFFEEEEDEETISFTALATEEEAAAFAAEEEALRQQQQKKKQQRL